MKCIDLYVKCYGRYMTRINDCGAYAFQLRYMGATKESAEYFDNINQRKLELTSVIEGLRALSEPCAVRVHTTSDYIKRIVDTGTLNRVAERGWKERLNGKRIKYYRLWRCLYHLLQENSVEFVLDEFNDDTIKLKAWEEVQKAQRLSLTRKQTVMMI